MRVYAPPSSSQVTAYPTLFIRYKRGHPGRLGVEDGGDSFDVPLELLECLVAFGKWKLKQSLAYPDADQEYMRYKQVLDGAIRTTKKVPGPLKVRRNGPSVMTWED